MILPDSIKKIGDKAFYGCYNLTNLVLPNQLEYIGEFAFKGYNGETLVIPSSVSYIGSGALDPLYNQTTFIVEQDSYAMQYCIDNKLNYKIQGT